MYGIVKLVVDTIFYLFIQQSTDNPIKCMEKNHIQAVHIRYTNCPINNLYDKHFNQIRTFLCFVL